MAKRNRPPPGKCVHCLADDVERDWDHVFPRSWYPDGSAANLYKWQIPSCIPCNRSLGAMEEEFLRRVALCMDPRAPETCGIVPRAMRSMDPAAAKNAREARIRALVRRRILEKTLQGAAIPDHGIYPGLGKREGVTDDEQIGILVPADSFRRLTEKIVRGIFYIEDRKFIEPPYGIDFFVLHPSVAAEMWAPIERFAKVYAREPGIAVRRAVAHDDGISSLFEIGFWGLFKTYASVEDGVRAGEKQDTEDEPGQILPDLVGSPVE